jgi:hypothetical protein
VLLILRRQHEKSVKEYYAEQRQDAAEKVKEELELASHKADKPSPLVNVLELVGMTQAAPQPEQQEDVSMSEPGPEVHATYKKATKVRRPPDRVAKRKNRDTLKVKAKIKKAKKKDKLPDRAALKEINNTTKVDSILRLVQYMAEFEADVKEDAGKLQPAPQVVKGVLLTLEERHAQKIEAVRKAHEEAEIARVAALPPSQRSLYHLSRSASSDERTTSSSLDEPSDLHSSHMLSTRRASNSGNSRRKTIRPPRSRSSERIRSRMVSGEPAVVGRAPPVPLRTIPITPRSNRPRSSSASSETSETDDEDDNESDWPVKKYAPSSSSRGLNYFQPNAALSSVVGRQSIIIEELGNGFSDEDDVSGDEDDAGEGDEDELDEDIDHETETDDEDEEDDDCDSVMPSPPRKWIERGSPFAEDEEDIGTSSSDSEGEAEAVAKNLITVPQNNDENCYYEGKV